MEARVHVLPVGQGSANLIEVEDSGIIHHLSLVDCGTASSQILCNVENSITFIAEKIWQRRNASFEIGLDYLFITHMDSDHFNLLTKVFKEFFEYQYVRTSSHIDNERVEILLVNNEIGETVQLFEAHYDFSNNLLYVIYKNNNLMDMPKISGEQKYYYTGDTPGEPQMNYEIILDQLTITACFVDLLEPKSTTGTLRFESSDDYRIRSRSDHMTVELNSELEYIFIYESIRDTVSFSDLDELLTHILSFSPLLTECEKEDIASYANEIKLLVDEISDEYWMDNNNSVKYSLTKDLPLERETYYAVVVRYDYGVNFTIKYKFDKNTVDISMDYVEDTDEIVLIDLDLEIMDLDRVLEDDTEFNIENIDGILYATHTNSAMVLFDDNMVNIIYQVIKLVSDRLSLYIQDDQIKQLATIINKLVESAHVIPAGEIVEKILENEHNAPKLIDKIYIGGYFDIKTPEFIKCLDNIKPFCNEFTYIGENKKSPNTISIENMEYTLLCCLESRTEFDNASNKPHGSESINSNSILKNFSSANILFQYNNLKVYFTGDSTVHTMFHITEHPNDVVKGSVLMAPHHGAGKTSRGCHIKHGEHVHLTDLEFSSNFVEPYCPWSVLYRFLAFVEPLSIYISAGYKNNYGHPNNSFVRVALQVNSLLNYNTHNICLCNEYRGKGFYKMIAVDKGVFSTVSGDLEGRICKNIKYGIYEGQGGIPLYTEEDFDDISY